MIAGTYSHKCFARNTNTAGSKKIGRATIAHVPGFFNKDDKTNFAIGHYGVWKKKEDEIDS